MEKIWFASYPKEVPAHDPSQYSSLVDLLEESFWKYATRPAYVCMDRFLTYGELDQCSTELASWLKSRGLEKGARVAIMMPNLLQYPIAVAGVLRAGYTVVNVDPLCTPAELQHQLIDSGAEVIIVLENFATTLETVIHATAVKHVVVGSMGDMFGPVEGAVVNFAARHVKKLVPAFSLPGMVRFNRALDEGAQWTTAPVRPLHDDVAFLQYTKGATGISKSATLTHRNIIANVFQNDVWLQPAFDNNPPSGALTIVCSLPLRHIFAMTACMMMGTRWGALNVLISNPCDVGGFVKELAKYRFNMFAADNTLFNALLNNAAFHKLDFSSLRISMGGGMAVQSSVNEQWLKLTGCPILVDGGLSKTFQALPAIPST